MKKNKFFSIIGSALMVGTGAAMLTSCADDLDLKPLDYFPAEGYWQDTQSFELNVIALMNQWRGNYTTNYFQTAGELRAGGYYTLGIDGSVFTNTAILEQNIDETQPVFSNFGNYYGFIANCNTFIYYAEQLKESIDPVAIGYMSGIVYGMRAMAYFQIHKIWGTGPLRTEPDVMLGNYDPQTLKKPRCTAEEMLTQIKSDIDASLKGFSDGASYNNSVFKANNGVYFWNKAATEMLAGEVYLWSAKVSTGNHKATGRTEVEKAKGYFENVKNNYGFALQSDYFNVFSTDYRGNKEVIYANYAERDEFTTGWEYMNLPSYSTGQGQNMWWWPFESPELTLDGVIANPGNVGPVQLLQPIEGKVNRLYYDGDKESLFKSTSPAGVNRFQYKNGLFFRVKKEDQRYRMWIPVYVPYTMENGAFKEVKAAQTEYFDPDNIACAGAFFYKYPGQGNRTGRVVGGSDMIYYRLPLVYTYLAECENYLGNYGQVETYINAIRERAYGDNWDVNTYGYTAGTFAENEVAILHEKDIEFIQEGQRWWDIRRMTINNNNGSDSDHLIFQPQSNVAYGLTAADVPYIWFNEVYTQGGGNYISIDTTTPVLNYATQKHLVLYPLDKTLLQSDQDLKQTVGYTTATGNGVEAE